MMVNTVVTIIFSSHGYSTGKRHSHMPELDGALRVRLGLSKLRRLFEIKTRPEAYVVIYALALGATERGAHYLAEYPGIGGKLLFVGCTGAVFLGGGKILDGVKHDQRAAAAPQVAGSTGGSAAI